MGGNNKTKYNDYNSIEIMGVFPNYRLYETNNIDTHSSIDNYQIKVNNYFELIKGECILEYLKLRDKFIPKRLLDYSTIPKEYHQTLIKMINNYLAIE